MAFTLTVLGAMPSMAHAKLAKGEIQQIAEEAFIYGFPMVMNYAMFYEYFVDKSAPAVQGAVQQLYNTARVYTPKDTTIVTPNSDTPYSFVAMDLRAEPFVLCNPEIEKVALLLGAAHRHVHVQLRLHGQPHHRQRRRLLHDRGPALEGREARRASTRCSAARPTSRSRSSARSSSIRPTSTT